MKTNEKNRMKEKNGITLIALIITIIVLLILAGVAISVLTGDNGVLNQATRAADNTNKETAKEELEMAYTTCQTNYLTDKTTNGSVVKSSYFTEEKINEALGDKGAITGMELDEESGTRTGTYYSNNAGKSYPFRINDAGKVEIVIGIAINKASLELQVIDGTGETGTLTATLYETTGTISWKSSDASVATVDSSGKVTAVGAGNATITATVNDGEYSSTCNVTVKSVVSISSITLDKSSLEIGAGETTTLTATVNSGATEDVEWESSDTSKVAIEASGDGKKTLTVKGLAVTSSAVTITAKSSKGTVTATCNVTVTNKYSVGDYIEYNVPYTDMYTGYEFSSTTGWRYLKTDSSGNNYLISTGIPAILYYYYSDTANNGWYGTNDEATSLFSSTDYNDRAAAGLRLHFDQIKFTYQADGTSVSTKNTGIFRKVGSVTSGSNVSLSSAFLAGGATSVRNVTREEIEDSSVGTTSVRYLRKLASESVTGDYTSSTYSYYWLASPDTSNTYSLYYVGNDGGVSSYTYIGLRCASSSCSKI